MQARSYDKQSLHSVIAVFPSYTLASPRGRCCFPHGNSVRITCFLCSVLPQPDWLVADDKALSRAGRDAICNHWASRNPQEIAVRCNGQQAAFFVDPVTQQCLIRDEMGNVMEPRHFERACGKGACNDWERTIEVPGAQLTDNWVYVLCRHHAGLTRAVHCLSGKLDAWTVSLRCHWAWLLEQWQHGKPCLREAASKHTVTRGLRAFTLPGVCQISVACTHIVVSLGVHVADSSCVCRAVLCVRRLLGQAWPHQAGSLCQGCGHQLVMVKATLG
jgi:hypothetical protein